MSDLGTIGRRRKSNRLGGPVIWSFILFAVVVGGVRMTLGEVVIVRGSHMAPNYLDGDVLLVGPTRALRHGDVVVIGDDDQAVFRRVIGLPGDTIASVQGTLTRDDSPLNAGECPPFTPPSKEESARERTCIIETTSNGEQYGTLGDFVSPDRPWFLRQEAVTLADDELFVLADDRKAAVEKNTTGRMKQSQVEGIVSSRIWRPDP